MWSDVQFLSNRLWSSMYVFWRTWPNIKCWCAPTKVICADIHCFSDGCKGNVVKGDKCLADPLRCFKVFKYRSNSGVFWVPQFMIDWFLIGRKGARSPWRITTVTNSKVALTGGFPREKNKEKIVNSPWTIYASKVNMHI